ncbi:MAG: hypothetical protein R3C14_27590 [Caldilineaceae bacterium]
MQQRQALHLQRIVFFLITTIWVAACGPASSTEAVPPTRTPVPTFTPTALVEAPATLAPTATAVPEVALAPTATIATVSATVAITTTTLAIAPTIAVAAEPSLTITGAAVNLRNGPDTTFAIVGAATQGERFPLTARNAQGDWWEICCINDASAWVYGELATVENADNLAIAAEIPTPVQPTPAPVAEAPTATSAPVAAQPPASTDPSAGDFNPDAAYQIVQFRVLGLDENNGGIRDSRAQHIIFVTVLDQNGNGVEGAVLENLVGEKGLIQTGSKGPGKTEIMMYYEPFKLRVASDPSGPVTSQVSNQMGLAFPHLPDIVGKLGGLDYEYAVCPTIDVKCAWPIQAVHFSYEITFQRVK